MSFVYKNRQWFDENERKPHVYVPEGKYREISPYPYITRDVTVDYSNSNDFIGEAISKGGKYLESIRLLDEYKNEKKHTVTFRFLFQSLYRTLTNEEVDKQITYITSDKEEY